LIIDKILYSKQNLESDPSMKFIGFLASQLRYYPKSVVTDCILGNRQYAQRNIASY